MEPAFVDRLNRLRDRLAKPLIVLSGYRCPAHNKAVSRTGEDGPHTFGRAVDLSASRAFALQIVSLAVELGFTGIGLRQHGGEAGRFVHLDDLPGALLRPRPTVWTYG